MRFLANPVQHYAWGATRGIPEILGVPAGEEPVAELWVGAHPTAPSRLIDAAGQPGQRLDEAIAAAPEAMLGAQAREAFGERLPFLLKVLSAATALSIQAHPSRAQATAGHAAEEAAGIPLSAPERNYTDCWHKPELIYALSDFDALCGFRARPAITATITRLRSLLEDAEGSDDGRTATPIEALDRWQSALEAGDEAAGLQAATRLLLTERETYGQLADVLADALQHAELAADGEPAGSRSAPDSSWEGSAVDPLQTLGELHADFPHDPGALVALMLNRLQLAPGEALALDAGVLHAYLGGLGVEIMASSDNVLRGGLTRKHIDVAELDKVVRYDPGMPALVDADAAGVLRGSTDDFALQAITEADATPLHRSGPAAALCTSGTFTLSDGTVLASGEAVFIPADAPAGLSASGSGRLFIASTGL